MWSSELQGQHLPLSLVYVLEATAVEVMKVLILSMPKGQYTHTHTHLTVKSISLDSGIVKNIPHSFGASI